MKTIRLPNQERLNQEDAPKGGVPCLRVLGGTWRPRHRDQGPIVEARRVEETSETVTGLKRGSAWRFEIEGSWVQVTGGSEAKAGE